MKLQFKQIYNTFRSKGRWTAIKAVVFSIFTHIYWWFYMNFVVKVISFYFNMWFLILASLKGELMNAYEIRNNIKEALQQNPQNFLDFYYQYASYSGYEVDDYINYYGAIAKNPFKDWNNWFITSILRGFKGDCDDYTSITSQLAKWAKLPHSKYITTILAYDKGKLKFENIAHAVVVMGDVKDSPKLSNKVLTWGGIYTIKEYNTVYIKRFSKAEKSVVIYSKY